MTAAPSDFPLNPDETSATAGRLRQITNEGYDHLLLGDGPPHPDHKLLELCSEALHSRRRFDAAWAIHKGNDERRFARKSQWSVADRAESHAEYEAAQEHERAMKRVLFKAKKIRATTVAGIYAKALIVRSSQTGAAQLAMSLADDLISTPELRRSIWPAEMQG